MKKIIIFLGLSIAILCLSTQSKITFAKNDVHREVKIAKNKNYSLNYFLKLISSSYNEHEVKKIQNAIKKNAVVKLSGKGISIKKNFFKIKKEGSYELKISAKKHHCNIKIKSVPNNFLLNSKKVSYVKILAAMDSPEFKEVEIRDRETVQQIIQQINDTKYVFNFKESSEVRKGFLRYYVEFYDFSNQLIMQLKLSDYSIGNSKDNTHWIKNSKQAKNVYKYVEKKFLEGYKSN